MGSYVLFTLLMVCGLVVTLGRSSLYGPMCVQCVHTASIFLEVIGSGYHGNTIFDPPIME